MCICIGERELYSCVSERYGEEADRPRDRETETEKQTESKTLQNIINAFVFINSKI